MAVSLTVPFLQQMHNKSKHVVGACAYAASVARTLYTKHPRDANRLMTVTATASIEKPSRMPSTMPMPTTSSRPRNTIV